MVKEKEFIPWVEKYRPKRLREIIGHEPVVKRLEAFVKTKNLPHLLLAGPPGTGKTACVLAMAHELYGDAIGSCFKEMNASDERGIDVVRGKIKDFARTLPMRDVSFKLILLDECDSMTEDAQQALRRTMELFSSNTRFCLSCVSPDTKILVPEELEISIKEFENRIGHGVISVDEKKKTIETDAVLHYTQLDPKIIGKRTLRIETMTGRKIDLTEDHLLLTKRGWVEAGALVPGDFVAVFPALEGTCFEENNRVIVGEEALKEFLYAYEIERGKNPKARTYRELPTLVQEKIIKRILELHRMIPRCLTKREKNVYDIISAKNSQISRAEIQREIGLSRMRAVQMLRSLERKKYVKRFIDKKTHSFLVIKQNAEVLRNKMDIKKKVENEFCVSVSYGTIKTVVDGKRNKRYLSGLVVSELKQKKLLPLTYSNPRIAIISRLFGFLLGNGYVTKTGRLIFTTDKESLKEIREDIKKLGFSSSKILSKILENKIRGRKLVGATTWFYVDSKPLAKFFEFLGVPVGDKCLKKFKVPDWIVNGTKLVKREFLRGIFGSELYSPTSRRSNGFEALVFRQHKAFELIENGRFFMKQLAALLEEFGVKTYELLPREVTTRKNRQKMFETGFWISTETKNMFNFLKSVGYVYSVEKERKGRYAAEYLRHKLRVLEKLSEKAVQILSFVKIKDSKKTEVAKTFDCSIDFVSNQIKGKDAGLPRNFPTFDEWKSRYAIDGSCLVWNEIASTKGIELNDVRDITCLKQHNFIANGIIAHNCNYSSKIIEPIQSRCAVFRFTKLSDTEVKKILENIASKEGLKLGEKALNAIVYVSAGDARKAINVLQGASGLGEKTVTEEEVFQVASRARPKEVAEMIELAFKGDFMNARGLLDDLMIKYGLSGEDVIQQIYREIVSLDISDEKKVWLVDRVGEYDFRLSEGANERIQLEALLAQIMLAGRK